MRIPALPRTPGRRARRPQLRFVLASAGLLLLSFVTALYIFFPTDALRERVEREFARRTGGTLTMRDLDLTFPPGLRGEKVTVTGLAGRDRIEAASITLKPLWLTLLTSTPGMRFSARLQGGELSGKYRKGGALSLEGEKVSFAETLTTGGAVRLAGTVRSGSFAGAVPVKPDTETRFNFALDDVRLTGMEGLGVAGGVLPLGTVTIQGTGKGNALRVDTLSASGGAVAASGNGTFLLASPRDRTRVNLNLTLRPAANIDPSARDLLQLFSQPAGDGSYRFRLSGTLGSPVFAR